MCKRHEESVDHLLIHCELAKALWNGVFHRVGLSQPMKGVDLLACWNKLHSHPQVVYV